MYNCKINRKYKSCETIPLNLICNYELVTWISAHEDVVAVLPGVPGTRRGLVVAANLCRRYFYGLYVYGYTNPKTTDSRRTDPRTIGGHR